LSATAAISLDPVADGIILLCPCSSNGRAELSSPRSARCRGGAANTSALVAGGGADLKRFQNHQTIPMRNRCGFRTRWCWATCLIRPQAVHPGVPAQRAGVATATGMPAVHGACRPESGKPGSGKRDARCHLIDTVAKRRLRLGTPPSLRDLLFHLPLPGLERPGYFHAPLRG